MTRSIVRSICDSWACLTKWRSVVEVLLFWADTIFPEGPRSPPVGLLATLSSHPDFRKALTHIRSQGSKPSWPEQAFKHHTRPDRLSTHPDLPSSLFRLQWGSVWPNLTMPSMTFQCHYFLNAANVTDYTGNHRILLFSVGEICVACTLIAAAAAEFISMRKIYMCI